MTKNFTVLAQFSDFLLFNHLKINPPNYQPSRIQTQSIIASETARNNQIAAQTLKQLYYVREQLEGTYGPIWLLTNQTRPYCLKLYRKTDLQEEQIEQFIINEISITSEINHPFILKSFNLFQSCSYLCYLSDYIQGRDLIDVMNDEGIFDADTTKFYVSNILLILEYLAEQAIILRDVRPESFLVETSGYLKLKNLSLSKKYQTSQKKKFKTYTIIGTAHYIAPEIISGKGYDWNVDLWGLGVLSFELLTGQYPFGDKAENILEIYESIIQGQVIFPEFVTDKRAIDFIEQMLSGNPNKRKKGKQFQSLKQHPWFSNYLWEDLISKRDTHYIPYRSQTKPIQVSQFQNKIPISDKLKEIETQHQKIGGNFWDDFGVFV